MAEVPKRTLHQAVCDAVGLLNGVIHTDAAQREAHNILRQALVDYADQQSPACSECGAENGWHRTACLQHPRFVAQKTAWSKDWPKVNGFYWMRGRRNYADLPIKVEGDTFWMMYDLSRSHRDDLRDSDDVQFLGPITPENCSAHQKAVEEVENAHTVALNELIETFPNSTVGVEQCNAPSNGRYWYLRVAGKVRGSGSLLDAMGQVREYKRTREAAAIRARKENQ